MCMYACNRPVGHNKYLIQAVHKRLPYLQNCVYLKSKITTIGTSETELPKATKHKSGRLQNGCSVSQPVLLRQLRHRKG